MTDPHDGRDAGRPRIHLVGYFGVRNVGDDAILAAIEAAATTLGVEIASFADRGASTDPRAVPTGFRGLPAQIRAIRRADRVVLGGGGILKDEGMRLPVELLITALLARAFGRRLTLLAVGVGPFYRPLGRFLVTAVARLAHVRTVRDAASADALRSLGVGRVVVGADPVFAADLADAAVTRPAGTDGEAAGQVLVSVRPWFHTLDEDRRQANEGALRSGLSAGLEPLRAAGWAIRFVPLYWPRDRDAATELVAAWPAGPSVEVLDAPIDWTGLLEAVAAADLVVAMRYHALAAAAITGRPVVAIAYEPKVAALAADLGVPTIAVDDPALGSTLAAVGAGAVGGQLPTPPDRAAVAALRQRAWSALRSALLE